MSLPENVKSSEPKVPGALKAPVLIKGQRVMLTITLSNRLQHVSLKPQNRVKAVTNDFKTMVYPELIKVFKGRYNLEISEVTAWDGKYYPRLHYHLCGIILNPVSYYLFLGYLTGKDYGFHTTLITKDTKEYYKLYIKKQQKEWDDRDQIVPNKGVI